MGLPRTPLAWLNLTHDRRRLLVAIAGIGFAVILMYMQTGFLYALLDSTTAVIEPEMLQADIVIVNKAQYALLAQQRFPRQRLVQAATIPGVANAQPIYIETYLAKLKNFSDAASEGRLPRPPKALPIRVLAAPAGSAVLGPMQKFASELLPPQVAIVDVRSRSQYGLRTDSLPALQKQVLELAGQRIEFVGVFALGADFANDGNVIMTDQNFARYFPRRSWGKDPLALVDLGAVQIEPGASAADVLRWLQSSLPADVQAFTRDEFLRREKHFWNTSTPVGFIFSLGTIMGFLVGVVICYQVLFASISDHMPEFATLKAIGYPPRYFIEIVCWKSFYLSMLGFLPGTLVSLLLYDVLVRSTGLLMEATVPRAALVYVLTLVMCGISGLLAMRKLMAADPVELF